MMKLVASRYLVLFNSASRVIYFYEQDGEFDKVNETFMAESLGECNILSLDSINCISFRSENMLKYIDFWSRLNFCFISLSEINSFQVLKRNYLINFLSKFYFKRIKNQYQYDFFKSRFG